MAPEFLHFGIILIFTNTSTCFYPQTFPASGDLGEKEQTAMFRLVKGRCVEVLDADQQSTITAAGSLVLNNHFLFVVTYCNCKKTDSVSGIILFVNFHFHLNLFLVFNILLKLHQGAISRAYLANKTDSVVQTSATSFLLLFL